jgi:hypothetical protein
VRGANDRIGIGLTGSGNQGRFDLSSMLRTGQVDSLAVADLKGDGQPVLMTGKRYYAHEHDPGANEPLGVYWYEKIQAEGRLQWRRHVIDYGGRTGGGIQIRWLTSTATWISSSPVRPGSSSSRI